VVLWYDSGFRESEEEGGVDWIELCMVMEMLGNGNDDD
jgi:hypothetical protein